MSVPAFAEKQYVILLTVVLLVVALPTAARATWSGEFPPSNYTPPLIVKPPRHPIRHSITQQHPHHHPSHASPEPGSVVSALLGSGLAWVYAWRRKRHARKAMDEREESAALAAS
jgi:hypothetical protein